MEKQELDEKLCNAIKKQDIETALEAIEEGADVNGYNYTTRQEGYPLRYSIVLELEPVFLKLMEKGANVHVEEEMPLRNCLTGNKHNIPFYKKAIKLLVERGAFVHFKKYPLKMKFCITII